MLVLINKIFEKIGSIFKKKEPVKDVLPKPKIDNSVEKKEVSISNEKNIRNKNQKTFKENINHPKKTFHPKEVWTIENFSVEKKEGMLRFHDLNLPTSVMHSIYDLKYKYCTQLQAKLLPRLLTGKDLVAKAETGSGKTAAYLITIINKLLKHKSNKRNARHPRAVILVARKEMAIEIYNESKILNKYSRLTSFLLTYGSDIQKVKDKLSSQVVEILVATPKELLEMKKTENIFLNEVEILVLDEAIKLTQSTVFSSVRELLRAFPRNNRQTIIFSSIYKPDLTRLTKTITKNVVLYGLNTEAEGIKNIEQKVFLVGIEEKLILLKNLIQEFELKKVLVYAKEDELNAISQYLSDVHISSEIINKDVPLEVKGKIIDRFSENEFSVLISDDYALEKTEIKELTYVINYSIPEKPLTYAQRLSIIGKTEKKSLAISFASEDDSFFIPAIERFTRKKLNFINPDRELLDIEPLQNVDDFDNIEEK